MLIVVFLYSKGVLIPLITWKSTKTNASVCIYIILKYIYEDLYCFSADLENDIILIWISLVNAVLATWMVSLTGCSPNGLCSTFKNLFHES